MFVWFLFIEIFNIEKKQTIKLLTYCYKIEQVHN